jgi:hypothetical protein
MAKWFGATPPPLSSLAPSVANVDRKGRGEPFVKTFWADVAGVWSDSRVASESAYWTAGRCQSVKTADGDFRTTCGELEHGMERRVSDLVRQRALAGDSAAQSLCFRTLRGFARAVDMTPARAEIEPLPPEVAEAMLAAGLSAMGLNPDDDNVPWTPGMI